MSRTRKLGIRCPKDYYITPQWCIDALIGRMRGYSYNYIVDVGAGDGRIGKSLNIAAGVAVTTKLIEPHQICTPNETSNVYVEKRTYEEWHKGNIEAMSAHIRLLMAANPPYAELGVMLPLMFDAVSRCAYGSRLTLLLRLDYLGAKKRADMFNSSPIDLIGVWVLAPRPSFENGSTDSGEYAWCCWEHRDPNTRLHEVLLKPQ